VWTLQNGYETEDDEVLPIRSMPINEVGFSIVNSLESYTCIHHGRGYKVFFHLPNEIPTPFHESQFVKSLYRKFFVINAKFHTTSENLRDYRPEIRRCYFEGEKKLKFFKSYTKALCDFECMTNYTLRQCGCVKFNMPREQQTEVCDLDKLQCCNDISKSWPNEKESPTDISQDCKCLKPCVDIEYDVGVEHNGAGDVK
jgi:amiloride-sensitive sodium channel